MIVFDLRAIDLMKIWRGATAHHSLLSLYSLQSLPLQAWHLCNMIKHQMWGFWSYFCQIFQENISPISMWQPRLAHGNTKWWWEKGEHPRQKPFYVGLKPQNTLAKTQSTVAKNRTHLQKTNTFAKKNSKHICKKMLHIRCFPEITEKTPKLEQGQMNSQRSFAGHIWIVSLVTNDPHACRCRGDNTWMGEGMGK